MKLLSIKPSPKPDKKYVAVFKTDKGTTKTTHFEKSADDYTKTHDKEQRARYLARHKKNESWNKPETAGSLSKSILWGSSTSIRENIASFKKKFNL